MPPPLTISSNVPSQFVRWNIVDYLATRFNYLPAERWRAWVEAGRVARNGTVCTAETIVTSGDLIRCALPDWEQPPANLNYAIIYEDEWLLGVNKPAGLRVHSGGQFLKMNLMYQLKYVHEPAYPAAELVNRLDADTSGVVLVGKGAEVVREMGRLFAAQQVHKGYLALVVGVPAAAEGVIDMPIGKVPHTRVRYGVGDGVKGAKPAVTRYAVEEAFGEGYALVRAWPETGRTHQIRVHLAAVGHPIVGDKLYRSHTEAEFMHWCQRPEAAADADLIGRQALHCGWTEFIHPFTGKTTKIEAPLAKDFAALIERLR